MGRKPNLEAREHILRTAYKLIHARGFNDVSADDVAQAAGIKKANLFYYYPSKEALGLAVFDWVAARSKQKLQAKLDGESDPIKVVDVMFTETAEGMKQNHCSGGCFVGNLAQELSDHNEKMRERISEYFNFWGQHLAGVLDRARATGYFGAELEPAKAAEAIVSAYEGALLCCKAKKQTCCLDSAKDMVLRYLQGFRAVDLAR